MHPCSGRSASIMIGSLDRSADWFSWKFRLRFYELSQTYPGDLPAYLEFQMKGRQFSGLQRLLTLIALVSFAAGCTTSASSRYFGLTSPPKANVMRYISGGEIESLDPPITNSQPDARILIALFDGLVEYHPKTMEPIPAIAESWETSADGTEYLFHLRHNAKFSNG